MNHRPIRHLRPLGAAVTMCGESAAPAYDWVCYRLSMEALGLYREEARTCPTCVRVALERMADEVAS